MLLRGSLRVRHIGSTQLKALEHSWRSFTGLNKERLQVRAHSRPASEGNSAQIVQVCSGAEVMEP